MVRWGDTFWGEGNRGFEVLSTNVKNGGIAIEELQRFLNESSQCESTYCKNLSRLQSQLLKVQHVGTFTPIWHSIRDLLEKIAQTHATTVSFYQDLLRDVHNYQDVYQKKVKTSINKDPDIVRTADLISQLNNAMNTVNKAKEQYHSVGLDYERAKRAGNNLTNGSSTPVPPDNTTSSLAQSALNSLTSSTRQLERLEKKYRQSHDDYRASIDKYNSLRNEFEKRFYDACTKFQDFDIDHAEKMLVFVLNYSEILKRNHEQARQAQNEFHEKLKLFTAVDLLETFVDQKRTGVERPVALQFEEIDNVKTSLHLNNSTNFSSSVTPDPMAAPSEELIFFDPSEANVPSFQAHFPVSSPTMSSAWPSTATMKKSDSNRALASSTSIGPQHLQSTNQSMSPLFNTAPMSLSNPNNPLARLQESTPDQTSNPFDVKIRRPAFKGFWPSNRKEKKDKKNDKKPSTNSKVTKLTPAQQQQQQQQHQLYSNQEDNNLSSTIDETNDFQRMMGSTDGLNQIVSNITKSKCPTPEPYTQSSPSLPAGNTHRPVCQSTIPFSSSARRKSTSSSDSSDDDDDDDDFPISKIRFTINSSAQKAAEAKEDDDKTIMNAMRLVDKNIGHLGTYSRSTGRRAPDMSKSVSIGQMNTRIPPPLPSRPASTITTSFTTDNFGQSPAFPPSPSTVTLTNTNDSFDSRPKSMTISSAYQENIPPFTLHPRSMTVSTEGRKPVSISSAEEDTEELQTPPVESTTNRTGPSTAPRPGRTRQSLQQPMMSSGAPSIANGRMTPFIAPNSQSFANGLMNSMDQRNSPLTIGATDQIPIAVAFQETIHVMMSGDDQTKWKIRILGNMLVSFPAAILNLLVDPSPHLNALEFRLQNLDKVENVIANPQLVTHNPSTNDTDGPTYSFNMSALSGILRNLQEKNRALPFFNFGILKYEVKHAGVSSIPIQVSSHWTRTFDTISVQINYRFHSSTLPESIRFVNDVVAFSTSVIDGHEISQSSPMADWSSNEHKLSWKIPYTFDGSGTLSATLTTVQSAADSNDQDQQQQKKPLTTGSVVQVQFLGENALFSSIDFDFACRGYRISLLKKKICSGKYQAEPDQNEPFQLFKRPSSDPHRLSLSSPLVA